MEKAFHIKKPDDLSKVNGNDINELLWWASYFGTNPEKLLSIVQKGGMVRELVSEMLRDKTHIGQNQNA